MTRPALPPGAQRTCRAVGSDLGTDDRSCFFNRRVFQVVVSRISSLVRHFSPLTGGFHRAPRPRRFGLSVGFRKSRVNLRACTDQSRIVDNSAKNNVPRNETSPPVRATPLSTRVSHAAAHGRSRAVASRLRTRHHAARDARTRRERRPEGEVSRGRERPGGRGRDGC
jgi:hypothetical protein